MKNTAIHRFHDSVGVSLPGTGQTVYLTARQARQVENAYGQTGVTTMHPKIIIITLTPGRLSVNGNRLTAWRISTPDGDTLAASKRAIDLPAAMPCFDQYDVADILRRAGLPYWKHVRAAAVRSTGWGWVSCLAGRPGTKRWAGTRADAIRALLQATDYTAGQLDFAFKAGQGYRLDSIERQTRPDGEPVYILTCTMDDHRGDLDGRYHITAAPIFNGGIGWRVTFCGDDIGGRVGTMTEALALMDQHRGERHTAPVGGAA